MPDPTEFRKVTLNLYADDVRLLQERYGYGWSENVRQWVWERLHQKEAASAKRD